MPPRLNIEQFIHTLTVAEAAQDAVCWSLTRKGVEVGRSAPVETEEVPWLLQHALLEIRDANDQMRQAMFGNITANLKEGKGILFLVQNYLQGYGRFPTYNAPGLGMPVPFGCGWMLRKGALRAADRIWFTCIYSAGVK